MVFLLSWMSCMFSSDQPSFLAIPEHCRYLKFKGKHSFQNNLPVLWEESLAACALKWMLYFQHRHFSVAAQLLCIGERQNESVKLLKLWKPSSIFPGDRTSPIIHLMMPSVTPWSISRRRSFMVPLKEQQHGPSKSPKLQEAEKELWFPWSSRDNLTLTKIS